MLLQKNTLITAKKVIMNQSKHLTWRYKMFKSILFIVAALVLLTFTNSLAKSGWGLLWLLPLYLLEIFMVQKAIKSYKSKKEKN